MERLADPSAGSGCIRTLCQASFISWSTDFQTQGICRSSLDEGYLFSPHCETKNAQKLQTFLLGMGMTKVRPLLEY
jgi:hypothetical protein